MTIYIDADKVKVLVKELHISNNEAERRIKLDMIEHLIAQLNVYEDLRDILTLLYELVQEKE